MLETRVATVVGGSCPSELAKRRNFIGILEVKSKHIVELGKLIKKRKKYQKGLNIKNKKRVLIFIFS